MSSPGLDGREIQFSSLSDTSGFGFFPTTGAVLISNEEDITGHVRQVCAYPFTVVYRAALKTQAHRLRVKELLDTLGKWLEMQPVRLGGTDYQLLEYPSIGDGREIKSISRSTPGCLNAPYQDGIEDWAIGLTLRYENEFDK